MATATATVNMQPPTTRIERLSNTCVRGKRSPRGSQSARAIAAELDRSGAKELCRVDLRSTNARSPPQLHPAGGHHYQTRVSCRFGERPRGQTGRSTCGLPRLQ